MPNRFFIIPKPGDQVYAWDVHRPKPETFSYDCEYFGRVFALVDEQLQDWNLDFLMTWNLDQTPMRGQNVVVFLIGDEMFQTPASAGRVKATFKTGGIKAFHPINPFRQPVYSVLEILRASRNLMKRCQRRFRNGAISEEIYSTIFPVPLGYHAQRDLPMVPLAGRTWDVFFAGSGVNPQWNKPKTWLLSPRAYSRHRLSQSVAHWQKKNQNLACNYVSGNSKRLSPAEYSAQLANSKICLVPRGNFHETFRFFEAARAGCILISEPVPDLWYYQGHPAVVVEDWNQLGEVLGRILNSPDKMRDLHEKTIAWWQTRACERAVADYVVKCIKGLAQPKVDKVRPSVSQ